MLRGTFRGSPPLAHARLISWAAETVPRQPRGESTYRAELNFSDGT